MKGSAKQINRSAWIGMQIAGGCLLGIWLIWWAMSYDAGKLVGGQYTWVPAFQALGLDFLHNYLGARYLLTTGNPYTHLFGDPMGIPYNYSPLVLGIFAWANWVDVVPAVLIWSGAIALIVALAAWYGAALRRTMPPIFAVAAMLWCSATVFSMERGNCDALALLAIVLAVIALRRTQSIRTDVGAGVCLALATLIKVYPALTILALPALRRWRAMWFAIAASLLISALTPRMSIEWLHNIRLDAARHQVPLATHVHTISGFWNYLFDRDGLRPIARIPRIIGAAIVLVPLLLFAATAVYREENRRDLIWPFLLFVTQLATFWSPVSYDYKLLFLPLAMLALWRRSSPWYAHVLLLPYLLYWQPIRIEFLGPIILLVIKTAALAGVAVLIGRAAKNQRATPSISGPQ